MRTLLLLLVLPVAAAFAQGADFGKAAEFIAAGRSKLQAKDYKGAVADFDKAVEAEPEMGVCYFFRGLAHLSLEDQENGIKDLDRAVELGFENARGMRARAYRSLHRYDEAREDLKAISATDPRALGDLGELCETMGDLAGAIAAYKKQIESGWAESAELWTLRAAAEYNLGDTKQAYADLENAIYCNAEYGEIYFTRGRWKLLEGDLATAQKDFEKAVAATTEESRKGRALFGLARFELDSGNVEDARTHLQKIVAANDPQLEYARLYLCLARTRLGEKDKGQEELRKYLAERKEKDDWFTKVAGFLSGSLSEEDFLKAAADGNKWLAREQECEAYWYAGATRLAAGDKETAKAYFEKCVATGVRNFIEYDSARTALSRSFQD